MSRLKSIVVLVCVLLTFSVAISQAATIYMVPSSQDVSFEDQLVIEIYIDFTDDPTLGGGIDIFYDSNLLNFVSFTFESGLGDDLSFRHVPDALPNQLDGLSFGHFNGLSGPSLIGTLTFNAISPGQVDLSLNANDTNWGGFFSSVTQDRQDVTFQGATANITPCNSDNDGEDCPHHDVKLEDIKVKKNIEDCKNTYKVKVVVKNKTKTPETAQVILYKNGVETCSWLDVELDGKQSRKLSCTFDPSENAGETVIWTAEVIIPYDENISNNTSKSKETVVSCEQDDDEDHDNDDDDDHDNKHDED